MYDINKIMLAACGGVTGKSWWDTVPTSDFTVPSTGQLINSVANVTMGAGIIAGIVAGDDGSVWYTNNHYETFTKLE